MSDKWINFQIQIFLLRLRVNNAFSWLLQIIGLEVIDHLINITIYPVENSFIQIFSIFYHFNTFVKILVLFPFYSNFV